MRKMKIAIATIRRWNIANALLFKKRWSWKYQIKVVSEKELLNKKYLDAYRPELIFFPHWSWLIPAEIYNSYECILFHMTDLPFGRGGSPLQNLLIRGYKKTKISALRVANGLDTGPIYMKRSLSLSGSASEIFTRCSDLIFDDMIPYILHNRPVPEPQSGRVTEFRRRKPDESRIPENAGLEQFYNYIRMLDAEGYPSAFLETRELRIKFSQAKMARKKLTAVVKIGRKEDGYE